MGALWAVLALPSRAVNAATGGNGRHTLCRQSLEPDAPLWLRILAACAEYFHRGHIPWTAGLPPS